MGKLKNKVWLTFENLFESKGRGNQSNLVHGTSFRRLFEQSEKEGGANLTPSPT